MSKITLLLLLCLPLLGQSADRVRHVFGAAEPLTAVDSRPPREILRNDRADSIAIPQVDNGGINVFVDNR